MNVHRIASGVGNVAIIVVGTVVMLAVTALLVLVAVGWMFSGQTAWFP